MDPQQELFTALLLKLKEKYEDTGIGVYDRYILTARWNPVSFYLSC